MLNCPEAIKRFSKDFVNPILEFITEDHFTHKLNYFVKDVLVMLLAWSSAVKPSNANVKKIIQFFIQHGENEAYVVSEEGENPVFRKDIFTHNLDLFETVIKHWVAGSEDENSLIPYDAIMDTLKSSNGLKTFGLKLCTRLLDAGVLPCVQNQLKTLMENVTGFLKMSPTKAICTVVAEACGAMLR